GHHALHVVAARPTVRRSSTTRTPRITGELRQFVEAAVFAGHVAFDGGGEPGVVQEEAEFDVAVLSAVGEVRAGQKYHLVVDDDELGVADDAPAVGQLG